MKSSKESLDLQKLVGSDEMEQLMAEARREARPWVLLIYVWTAYTSVWVVDLLGIERSFGAGWIAGFLALALAIGISKAHVRRTEYIRFRDLVNKKKKEIES